jgi:hypothetical protein
MSYSERTANFHMFKILRIGDSPAVWSRPPRLRTTQFSCRGIAIGGRPVSNCTNAENSRRGRGAGTGMTGGKGVARIGAADEADMTTLELMTSFIDSGRMETEIAAGDAICAHHPMPIDLNSDAAHPLCAHDVIPRPK